MDITEYLNQVERKLATGMAAEHAHRPTLERFLKEKLTSSFEVINDGKRIECGMPDLVIYKKLGNAFIDIGYIEAKDIHVNLDKEEKSDQLKRYRESLQNLAFTDYLEFRFFIEGEKVETIKIAEYENGVLTPLPENFEKFDNLITNFLEHKGQKIKSSKKLAEMMAKKARLMKDVFHKAVTRQDDDNTLREQYEAFKSILIHDLTYEQFADVYAQTITYGLFTARIHDQTPDDFSRQEARELIPRSNPFLRQLFDYISGASLDERVVWIVDDLCELFKLVQKDDILKEFSFKQGQQDPIIHFYETFLAEYDPKLRKARGVWYTPEPVVNFIIRAIDDCLIKYFNLPDGIASKDKVKIKTKQHDPKLKSGYRDVEKEFHKVQMLDVASGTGTFLAEAVKHIYTKKFENQKAAWSNYVDEHLLPRLHGFEILMASYAMCHLKIDLLLEQLGYKQKENSKPKRLSVYLTNSLEEAHPDTGTLFASWLSKEAAEANNVKKEAPVMVAFGNPPYSVSSSNKGKWIQDLIKDYKKDLNEKKINLDDDYIKFLRYAEHYIEKNGFGIVAMITNNSFIDGITHRQMRKHLLETFDDIYIYDLHGSAKKKETTPEGKPDKNVFDIQQGVSINIFVKHKDKGKELANVWHADAYGSREQKYDDLLSGSISKTGFKKLEYKEPYYFFVPKDFEVGADYNEYIVLGDLFKNMNSGIQTKNDSFTLSLNKENIKEKILAFKDYTNDEMIEKYNVKEGVWKLDNARKSVIGQNYDLDHIVKIEYRPFDQRWTFLNQSSSGFLARPRYETTKHLLNKDNFALITMRQYSYNVPTYCYAIISKSPITDRFFASTNGTPYIIPLYLYPDPNELDQTRQPNLDSKIVNQISKKLKLPFVPDHDLAEADGKAAFSPLDLLDYIYAVLHSPTYRGKYKEFLKIDFPRIPYPENAKQFWQLVALGKQIRELHLLESAKLSTPITAWNIEGDNIVEKPKYENGNVYINKEQCFENVPEIAWNFYIGGYQPAQKWLKDRKGRELSSDDTEHYQKIIIALLETDKLMKEIDEVWEV